MKDNYFAVNFDTQNICLCAGLHGCEMWSVIYWENMKGRKVRVIYWPFKA
jgi:hypothetical protein